MKTKLEGSLNIPLSKNSRLSSAPVPLVGGKVCRMVLFNMRLGQSYDFVLNRLRSEIDFAEMNRREVSKTTLLAAGAVS